MERVVGRGACVGKLVPGTCKTSRELEQGHSLTVLAAIARRVHRSEVRSHVRAAFRERSYVVEVSDRPADRRPTQVTPPPVTRVDRLVINLLCGPSAFASSSPRHVFAHLLAMALAKLRIAPAATPRGAVVRANPLRVALAPRAFLRQPGALLRPVAFHRAEPLGHGRRTHAQSTGNLLLRHAGGQPLDRLSSPFSGDRARPTRTC